MRDFVSLLPTVTFALILLIICVHDGSAFVVPSRQLRRTLRSLHALPSPEESAKALSDYMAKAHTEKLRALKEIETKKNAEIEALKTEVAALKGGGAAATSSTPPAVTTGSGDLSIRDLQEKLLSYQRFMAKYIVEAQEQKLQAVEEAKVTLTKQYEEKLLALGGGSAATPASTPTPTKSNTLYEKRNDQVSQAAKAGKSRWGAKEIAKVSAAPVASSAVATPVVNGVATTTTIPDTSTPPPEVVAADHGLRADGGVGGPTLAQRVANGANGMQTTTASVPSTSLYAARNAMVNAAASAGKSRWGSMETSKVGRLVAQIGTSSTTTASAPSIKMTPEIEAADHGLRADGGVSGPSLAERVNLGAQLMGKQ